MKPYLRFLRHHQWLLAGVAALVGGCSIDALDIAVHDTYYVIPGPLVGCALACFLFTSWGVIQLPIFRKSGFIYSLHLFGNTTISLTLLFLLLDPVPDPVQRIYSDYRVFTMLWPLINGRITLSGLRS